MTSSSQNWEALISSDVLPSTERKILRVSKLQKRDLALYTRKVASLLKSSVPIVDALKLLLKQSPNAKIKSILLFQIHELEGGKSFSSTLMLYPEIFDTMYVNLVLAGEKAGVVDLVMLRLAQYLENSLKTRTRVVAASAYPIVVLFASVGIVLALLVFVVPQFEDIFESMLQGASLPRSTEFVLGISRFLQGYWYTLPPIVGAWFCLWKISLKNEKFVHFSHKLMFINPWFRALVEKAILGKFSRTLALLLESAVPILDALQIASNVSDNTVFRRTFERIKKRVLEGESLSASMETEAFVPDDFTGLIEIAEATGELPAMLKEIAGNYEGEIQHVLDGMTSVLEPILILILAVVVGSLVLSLFLPIVEIMQHLGS